MADRYVCCLHGKARADGEPASVTDEKPARDSAGRCGPVDYGLPFPPPPWFGVTSEIVLTGARWVVSLHVKHGAYCVQLSLTPLQSMCQQACLQIFSGRPAGLAGSRRCPSSTANDRRVALKVEVLGVAPETTGGLRYPVATPTYEVLD
jgi:hypothetical protein